uniref:Phospholipid-transporting ATPase n=1 Tax=Mucochytrium quahogii TaxID=96639 RepID=A0A7S2RVA5_9STRA|mmetsp:Transcript_10540/g.19725  ORF Transcript_10540/g.19725 Transcript_10540/m.19725 type:complete len:1460 (+) Transcript_10540:115-4494(+)|eukprot:CAMPEP_0203746286 /NCGR_PEP_ID=MMETSP0098-20131031/1770_1 /ASSEMBLY_ACC=CAM_ASM_000208 /TAXON_ID=96639 /ORGANISM=" , Strain NY0313808BC1" /LENGTH=1459 /DNA_ID=CAMNT_0050634321 /DNA_START=417 /DNA_END=4796 /DNA_ORIENTATION=-
MEESYPTGANSEKVQLLGDGNDQASAKTLDAGGEILRKLFLSEFFEKPVVQPRKGEVVGSIHLQVPFTKSFLKEQRKNGYALRKTNLVRTSKYNLWSFVPVAAALQFRRFANMFYLCIAILAGIGYFVPNSWVVSISPMMTLLLLAVIVAIALLFEGRDDILRHKADRKTNNHPVLRVRNNSVEETIWGELIPGDLVFVNDRGIVPADILVLATYGADKKGSACYVETSSIDGETNLKIKEVPSFMTNAIMENTSLVNALTGKGGGGACETVHEEYDDKTKVDPSVGPEMHEARTPTDHFKALFAKVVPSIVSGLYTYEQPNSFLQFMGTFTPVGSSTQHPLDFKSILLRGSQIRNTKWVLGLVMYAGPETKLALSRKPSPAKLSRIDHFMNKMFLGICSVYTLLVTLSVVLLFTASPDTNHWWYFKNTSSKYAFTIPGPLAYVFTYIILFASIIPISIIALVEILGFYAQYVLGNDRELYHEETNTRASCRTSSLVAEIGQVTHIFSDKTGTLTRNQMKLVGCYIQGKLYGYVPPKVGSDDLDSEVESLESLLPLSKETLELSRAPKVTVMEENEESVEDVYDDDDAASIGSIQIEDVFADVIELLKSPEESAEKRAVLDYFVLLAVCHTVVLSKDEDGAITLNAESPDEEAFVHAAGIVGVTLKSTEEGMITIETPLEVYEYRVLALNAFNSTRKRMSLVVNRVWDDSISVMMKGADNVVFERLAPGQESAREEMSIALDRYSWGGLRTLVMAQKDISTEEFLEWETKYNAALVSPSSTRGAALAAAALMLESNFHLVGASAIEDQLQLGVPAAIETLRGAGIQVWVLTGDKVETAINIGLSSNLIDSEMMQLKLVADDAAHLETQIDGILKILEVSMEQVVNHEVDELLEGEDMLDRAFFNVESPDPMSPKPHRFTPTCCANIHKYVHESLLRKIENHDFQANFGLIISGQSLELLLHKQKGTPELERKLLCLARTCKVVLACRVSPAQKSLIVEMVRYAPDVGKQKRPPLTLAIGDGANDVPMIQAAHVGVGICGHEGTQAVNSSDFSIGQFRFLVRMMLVHGRWNYRRMANLIVYVVYSWMLFVFLLFTYLPFSLYSGSQIFFSSAYVGVLPYFANLPIVVHGWFDKDISAEIAMRNPWTYAIGVKSDDLNHLKLATSVLRALAHCFIIWGLVMMIANTSISYEVLGTGIYLALVIVLFMVQMLRGLTITSVTILIFVVLIAAFFIFMSVATTPPVIFTKEFAAYIWAGVFLASCAVIFIEMTVRYVKKEFFPRPLDLLQEQDRGYYKGEKHARHAHRDALKVIEEFGKITVLPLNLGAKRLKKAVEKVDSQKLVKSMSMSGKGFGRHTSAGQGSKGRQRQMSSALSMFRPAFDYGFTKASNALTFRHKKQSVSEIAEADDSLYAATTTRIDLHNYRPASGSDFRLKSIEEMCLSSAGRIEWEAEQRALESEEL